MTQRSEHITILNEHEINFIQPQLIGGKAKGLAFLLQNGLNVPEFYVIDFNSIQVLMQDADLLKMVIEEWQHKNNISPTDIWAVRSSAANEDGTDKSFAGQFTSVLHVKTEELTTGIKTVINSYDRENAYAEKPETFGIIIQKMLDPSYSGVFFSRDPILHYSDQPVISIIPGIGDKLVAGELDGYSLHFKDEKPIFKKTDKIEGEYHKGNQRVQIIRSSNEIKNALSPHITKMISVANRLEKIQNCALDFEFAIQNGVFFWLQVRPITTRPIHPTVEVWDNTSSEANYPGITLPLTISFVRNTFSYAYGGGAKELGFNTKVLHYHSSLLRNMSGEINGALYYNVTAWQTLIYLMPFGRRLSIKLPSIWGMEEATFPVPQIRHSRWDKLRIAFRILEKIWNEKRYKKEYLNLFQHHIEEFDDQSIQNDSWEELIVKYQKIESELGSKWLTPVLNGFNTMLVLTLLKRKIRQSKIGTDYPNFINDILLAEGDVKSVQLIRKFQNILSSIYHSNELTQFFHEHNSNEIWHQLPLKFPTFYNELWLYINEFGNRTDQGELKLETISYKQQPNLFIHFIQLSLKGFSPTKKSTKQFDYKSIVRNYYPVNFIQRWYINKLISSAINRMKARENYRFMRTDTFAVIRSLFLQMGKVLQAEKHIENENDVLYLEMEELLDILLKKDFRKRIENRKEIYLNNEKKERCNRYMKVNDVYFGVHDEDITFEDNTWKGTACCSGTVSGEIIVINKNTDFNQDFSNHILIAAYFEPGWIHLFNQAKGIISERGNLLSHTAIICRELNIPSIVGAKGILKKVKTGDMATMDGERGMITVLENESF